MSNKDKKCEKCGAIMPFQMTECSFCQTKKAGKAFKKLFGILVDDVKGLAGKATKKIRIKTDDN